MEAAPAAAVEALRAALAGPVFARGDAGLQEEVLGHNLASIFDPDFVISPETERDAVLAVKFANEYGLPISISATGHGSYRPVLDGILIRTHHLQDMTVDDAAQTFTIGAGKRWLDIVSVLREHGLLAVTGSATTVGAIGLSMGGGVGPLARKLGIAADYILEYRFVTGAGELITLSNDTYPDLFRAVKGGKVGFGLVVSATFQALPIEHVYGGGLMFDVDAIEPAFRAWIDWTKTVPEEVTTSVNIVRFPPEGVGAALDGRTILHVRYAYVDPDASDEELVAKGEEWIAPIRAAAPVYLDLLELLAADELGKIHLDPPGAQPMAVYGHGLVDLDQGYADVILRHAGGGVDVPFVATETRHWGGKVAEHAGVGNSIGGGKQPYHLLTIAKPVPELFVEAYPRAVQALLTDLAPHLGAETNYNWTGSPDDAMWPQLWDSETFAWLESIRAKYDPNHIFTTGH